MSKRMVKILTTNIQQIYKNLNLEKLQKPKLECILSFT